MESCFSLEGLSEKEMIKTDGDTALWLKTLGLQEIFGQSPLLEDADQTGNGIT